MICVFRDIQSGRIQTVLEISDLKTALIGPVSLAAEAGECVAILGESGSGKSLLLRAIADLDPGQGDVRLDGTGRAAMPAFEWRRQVALVPAESGWWTDRVGEHFADRPDVAGMLDQLGLPEALDWDVSRLSTGERQRLALVRALQAAPRALLLDEPTAALDGNTTPRVEAMLEAQMAAGVAIVLVTHDPEQADRLAARRFSMADGRLTPVESAGA